VTVLEIRTWQILWFLIDWEMTMPVFAVLAHTEPEMLHRLIVSLAPYPVVVHLDRHANAADFAGLPRTTYVEDRVSVNWSGYSVVEATARMFELAHRMVDPGDHVVLLSGQCQPIRPIEDFVQYLSNSPWKQHCKSALVFDGSDFSERRLNRNWYYDALPLRRTARSRRAVSAIRRVLSASAARRGAANFSPLVPVRGSQWIALTGECIQDLLPVARSAKYISVFKNALASDEMFFHTLVYNSLWRSEMQYPNLIHKPALQTWELANFHFIEPSMGRPLTDADLEAIKASHMFFGRKFSGQEGASLIESMKGQK